MKLRVKFSKKGIMKFIGHLDTMRYFQKANRRAGIDVAYSEGYSPHQKMSFAQPLSVGVESEGEYFDLEVRSVTSSEDMISRWNECRAEGIRVEDCVLLPEDAPNAMASVYAADYEVRFREDCGIPFSLEETDRFHENNRTFFSLEETDRFREDGRPPFGLEETDRFREDGRPPFSIEETVEEFHRAKEWIITKETKKGSQEMDLKEFVYALEADHDPDAPEAGPLIRMRLSAASGSNVKPVQLLGDFFQRKGFALPDHALLITRKELYTEDGKPLIEAGEHFS